MSRVHEHEKTCWVMVEGDPTQERLTQLERDVQLKNYVTLPCKARLILNPNLSPRLKPVTPHGRTACIEIKLHEGKTSDQAHDCYSWFIHVASRPCGDWADPLGESRTWRMA